MERILTYTKSILFHSTSSCISRVYSYKILYKNILCILRVYSCILCILRVYSCKVTTEFSTVSPQGVSFHVNLTWAPGGDAHKGPRPQADMLLGGEMMGTGQKAYLAMTWTFAVRAPRFQLCHSNLLQKRHLHNETTSGITVCVS